MESMRALGTAPTGISPTSVSPTSISQVHLDHLGVLLHVVHLALGQYPFFVQHRDPAPEGAHELHVVLDHDDGVAAGQGSEQRHGVLDLLMRHPRDRLVEEQEPRGLHEQHPDLEPLLLAVGERPGAPLAGPRQAVIASTSSMHSRASLPRRATKVGHTALLAWSASHRFSNTVWCSNTVGRWNLRPIPTVPISGSERLEIDVVAKTGRTVLRPGLAGDDVHERGLARPVRPDQTPQLVVVHVQGEAVRALKPSKETVRSSM